MPRKKKVTNGKDITSGTGEIRDEISEAFDEVPGIGDVLSRWYDIPYKILVWLLTGWRRKIVPGFIRNNAHQLINHLLQYNVHDRNKIWNREDPTQNLLVPSDEHVAVPSVWVVELFPPNEVPALERAIAKNGWNNKTYGSVGEKNNVEALNLSRSGKGYSWWSLAKIADMEKGKDYIYPGAKNGKLPIDFTVVKLNAVQVGTGITAVVAQFVLTDKAAELLDEVWHTKHEPTIIRYNGTLHPQDRMFSSFRMTQKARLSLHNSAREWMIEKIPGFFARKNEQQLVMDLMLFSKYNPAKNDLPDYDFIDALKALGIKGDDYRRNVAKQLPEMLFTSADNLYPKVLDDNRTWSLIGNRDLVRKAHNNFEYQGGDTNHGSAHYADEYATKTLILLAVSEMLSILENRYATLRDRAKLQHGAFKVSQSKKLSDYLLDLSLTLTSISRDLKHMEKNGWRLDGADFESQYSPHVIKKRKELTDKSSNMSKDLVDSQSKVLKQLIEADSDYRNILSTVASLGAATNSITLGRWALGVSAISLIVASIALTVQLTAQPKVSTDKNNMQTSLKQSENK